MGISLKSAQRLAVLYLTLHLVSAHCADLRPSEGGTGHRWTGHLEEQAPAPQPRGQAALPEHLRQERHHLHGAVHHEPRPLL